MSPADELNNPPFDTTTASAETTNFGTMYTIKVKSWPPWPPESPVLGQNLDATAWNPSGEVSCDVPDPAKEDYWAKPWPFGPTKHDIRQTMIAYRQLYRYEIQQNKNLQEENWELRKQVTALQKQCVVHEKMHDDMAAKLKRAELELAATEITVLNLREQVAKTAKRKPGRPKKTGK